MARTKIAFFILLQLFLISMTFYVHRTEDVQKGIKAIQEIVDVQMSLDPTFLGFID